MLTSQQEALLVVAQEKGFVTVGDSKAVYSSDLHRRQALRLLVQLGFLRASPVPNRFDYVGGGR